MTTTLTLTPEQEQQRLNDEAIEAYEAEQRRLAGVAAQKAVDRDRIERAAELERLLDSIDLAPFDAAVWDALDNLAKAADELIAASREREQAKDAAVAAITPHKEHTDRIRDGFFPALDGYVLNSRKAHEGTEAAYAVAPMFAALNDQQDMNTPVIDALNRRRKGGHRLPRPTKG